MNFFDSHTHLTSPELVNDAEAVIHRAKAAGVQMMLNIATDSETLARGLELAKKHSGIYCAAAVHPHDTEKEGDGFFPIVAQHARQGNLVAIGETGLDYFYTHSNKESQKQYFKKHLHLALECNLPVIIHCRDAFPDFFEIIDAEYIVNGKHGPGVLHCFTGTIQDAEEVIHRGWYLSLSGIVTYKKSTELREVARKVPLDKLLIETDAPYLAPQSKRGKLNEPAYMVETAEVIAACRGISLAELAQATTNNAKTLFKRMKDEG